MASGAINEDGYGGGGFVRDIKDGGGQLMDRSNIHGVGIGEGDDGTFLVDKRPTSKLRLELSNDAAAFQLVSVESPLPNTPSRMSTTASDGGIASPSMPGTVVPEPTDASFMPMPTRRRRYTKPGDAAADLASAAPISVAISTPPSLSALLSAKRERFGDIRPRPWIFEIPPTAPRYAHRVNPGGGGSSIIDATRGISSAHGDFFPWNGSHIEDTFTDGVIKNGFFDKSPVGQSEPVAARTSLATVLKHKSGLAQMSHMLVSAMGRRRQRGQVTIPSTFKPPPRVTLTDTKREIWLKDLANRAISLRKLSRTIPHGIRGRVLLDHCLNKNVPVDRAVWLSKCVGANELRSFRRKGAAYTANATVTASTVPVMGGELKYIRDWTASVEQFVGGLADHFEDGNWKTKMAYA
jgi:mediator of RNA polymerase II transcription subunit 12